MLKITTIDEKEDWIIENQINASPLQYASWGKVKTAQGWEYLDYKIYDEHEDIGKALVLYRHIPKTNYNIAFIPFGPVLKDDYRQNVHEVIKLIINELKQQRVLLLRVHPYLDYSGVSFENWVHIEKMLYSETFVVDLTADDDTLLANLHKKLRNEVRKAEKLGTKVITDNTKEGLKIFYEMHLETFKRTNYTAQPLAMFEKVFEAYVETGRADIRFAEIDGKKISGAIFLKTSKCYLYMWGASLSDSAYNKYEGQKYLIWESMLEAKKCGAKIFDLGGVTVGADKGTKREGIYIFKSRFGGELKSLPGTFDVYIGNRLISYFISKLLSLYLNMKEK